MSDKLKVLDLFSGIGGFSLGLERAGMETVAFCEIDPFCRKVLKKHWPDVPIYEDVRNVTKERLAADGIFPDIITGGFPCQPFSTASHGVKVAIDMWPEMLRVISEVNPRFALAENVQRKPIKNAGRDLEKLGYGQFYRRIGGDELGSIDQRNRWWLCAYTHDKSELHSIVDAKVAELQKVCKAIWGRENFASALRISDGVSSRVDRLRALGNSVKPQVPEMYGMAIMESHNE